ncbi:MAG: helix-turn-helix domain-containing protein [Ruminococcaceae bacterium]|nr:helix-turn-helix domain-containing protein [Oscillospiraceae bacterium]
MNQIKIGAFIAEQRKKHNLTQAALGEKLGITDRAVSKWERGKGMPDASLMLGLCEVLEITVNELLCGEKIEMENNNEKTEALLLELAKSVEEKNKIIWKNMWLIMSVSMIAMLAGLFAVAFFVPEGVWQLVAIIGICVFFLIPCFYALKLEVSVGYYKCKNCGGEVIPTYRQALMAMHRGTTRYLQCPKCGKRSWCKKVIKK